MSPFTRCEKGHDLTVDDAWLYGHGGNRVCRACALETGKKRREKVAYGAFDGGMAR